LFAGPAARDKQSNLAAAEIDARVDRLGLERRGRGEQHEREREDESSKTHGDLISKE
jgi:hypothetical protein